MDIFQCENYLLIDNMLDDVSQTSNVQLDTLCNGIWIWLGQLIIL